ncbi:MAG: hypothetical protein K6E76_05130 [Patescibacteria group bacterium]|nr:hypothetical protein [Patescibacteria group bacterium]
MVIYPFFLLYGLTIGIWEKEKSHILFVNQQETEKKKYKKKKKSDCSLTGVFEG